MMPLTLYAEHEDGAWWVGEEFVKVRTWPKFELHETHELSVARRDEIISEGYFNESDIEVSGRILIGPTVSE